LPTTEPIVWPERDLEIVRELDRRTPAVVTVQRPEPEQEYRVPQKLLAGQGLLRFVEMGSRQTSDHFVTSRFLSSHNLERAKEITRWMEPLRQAVQPTEKTEQSTTDSEDFHIYDGTYIEFTEPGSAENSRGVILHFTGLISTPQEEA
jgi:hypothetical protein